MRQDQDSNICFNYNLTSEIKCSAKDEKTWHLTINDCSEGESRVENFCLKFPSAEHALKFKVAVDMACNSQAEYNSTKKEKETDDVVFVSEILASNEDKQRAIELKLPENFYTYKSKPPCQGCRGCNDEDVTREPASNSTTTTLSNTTVGASEINISTPADDSKQSPANMAYGTTGILNETADVSIFRTPLAFVSNTLNSSRAINKDNTLTEKSSSGLSEQNLTFGTTNIFSPQPSSVTKKSILAPPKLDTVKSNISTENKSMEFENKPIQTSTGVNSNKSIFDLSSNSKEMPKNSEVKSIFGDDQKPINLFSGMGQGSMFGPSALKTDAPKLGQFSPFSTQGQTFSSFFGKGSSEAVTISSKPKDNINQATAVTEVILKDNDASKDDKENKVAGALKVDNELSFAALSSNASGFNIQRKIALHILIYTIFVFHYYNYLFINRKSRFQMGRSWPAIIY